MVSRFFRSQGDEEHGGGGNWNHPEWFFSTARYGPGGPTFYSSENRMSADLYLTTSIIAVICACLTCLLVLVVTLPIIKHRLNTVITAINSMALGVTIWLCLLSPEWLSGSANIQSPISYYDPKIYDVHIGVHIGLTAVNITCKSIDLSSVTAFRLENDQNGLSLNNTDLSSSDFYFNEEIKLYNPYNYEGVMEKALKRGAPIPLLTLYDFITSANRGFQGSFRLLEAGYHCYTILMLALVGWFIAMLLIAAIPRYSAYAFIVIGLLMLFTTLIYFYWAMIDRHFPLITVTGEFIELKYGICFWVCLGFGIWSCLYGFMTATYDNIHPDKFLTAFDLDYDHKRALATAHRLNVKVIEEEPEMSEISGLQTPRESDFDSEFTENENEYANVDEENDLEGKEEMEINYRNRKLSVRFQDNPTEPSREPSTDTTKL